MHANDLTIVMYHYVRPLEGSRYPGIKGLRLSEFRAQLAHIRANYSLTTVAQVVDCLRTGEPLPPRAALLTFDDGYLDHFQHVFPLLFEAGIQGAFFPPVAPIERGELLDVNRVHFLLAVADPPELAAAIDAAVIRYQTEYGLETPTDYRARWARPNRFDSADIIYVKRMLQIALPKDIRNHIARELFARHVSTDEIAFAGELYMTMAQVATMQGCGMYVGSHGTSHSWLDSLDADEQRQEVMQSLNFLRRVGSPVDDYWVMCYPYGAWNSSLLSVLRNAGCTFGLTTDVAVARLREHDALLLPRIDTNDLPKTAIC